MHTALRAGAGHVLLAASGLVLAGALFFGGGSGDGAEVWLGACALGLVTAAVVLVCLGRADVALPSRSAVVLSALVLGLLGWAGISVLWSVAPDRSWDFFNKGLVLVGFLGLGLLAGLGPRAARRAAAALAALVGAALVWALLGKAIPGLFPDGGRIARLRSPVGYWNGLALVGDFALPLGLWLGTRAAHRRAVRVAGGLLVYLAVASILLAASRTGVVAGSAAVALWLALSRERVEGALLALAGAIPAAVLVGWAFTRPALVDDGQPRADRVHDGAIFGVLALVGAAVVCGLVLVGLRHGLQRGREVGRGLAVASVALAAVALVALVVSVGNPVSWSWHQFTREGETTNQPGRLGTLGGNNRWQWWQEAAHVWRAHELAGSGAGSFEVVRKRYRENAQSVREPHNVPLQVLADLGLVGFGLFAGVAVAGLAVARGALRRLTEGERAAAVALAVLPAAWLVHSLADYDLDFLAVTAPALFSLGVLGSVGRPATRVRQPFWAVAAIAVVAVAVASLASPRLAERELERSTAALERGDYSTAADDAKRAGSLDPFSLEPVFARAGVGVVRRDPSAALAAYADAVDLQPENPTSWLALGEYEFFLGRLCDAYRDLNNAYTLDPNGAEWTKGGELDRAREYVNAGRCS